MTHKTFYPAIALAVSISLLMLASCGGKSTRLPGSARQLFDMGMSDYQHKKYLGSVEKFQQVVYNYPGEPLVDTAQYYLALSYYGNEDYALAGVEFNRLVVNYPASTYAAQSQFMKAVCAFENTPKNAGLDQSELDDAIRLLEDFIVEHPESPSVPDANAYLLAAKNRLAKKYYNAAVVYTRVGASEAAKIYYQKVIDDYTGSEYAPLAAFNIAQEEMNLGKFDEAKRRFDNFVVVYPNHKLVGKAKKLAAEAAFKAGEVAMKKGDWKAASDKFQAFKKDYPGDDRNKQVDLYLKDLEGKLLSNAPQPDGKS